MIQAVVFAMAAAQAVPSGAPSPIARDYFMDARRAYRTAAYAEGTNSVIRRYSREDPFGVDAKYDQPDLTRRQIPDEPTVWGLKGLRNVRDIGGWTGLRPGMVYRGSQLYRVADAPDGRTSASLADISPAGFQFMMSSRYALDAPVHVRVWTPAGMLTVKATGLRGIVTSVRPS